MQLHPLFKSHRVLPANLKLAAVQLADAFFEFSLVIERR